MNKRMQKKVAKRNGGIVRPHSVATPKRKKASGPPKRRAAGASPEGQLPGARELALALAKEVQERAVGVVEHAVEQLKDKLSETEQRAEKLIAKVPGVGPKVAKKLHDVAGR